MTDQAATGGLSQKPTDNPPLTAQWPHKKVWLAKTGHWAEYDDLTVEQFVQGYIEIVLPTTGPCHTDRQRSHLLPTANDEGYVISTLASRRLHPQTDPVDGGAQTAQVGECCRQRRHQSCPATYSQRRSNPRKVLQPPGQVYQTREQATAQGGAQALPQLQQQYLHPPKRPRHRWDQDVARLCPLLYARQSSSPPPGVSQRQHRHFT